jgi:hypothetical protein
MLSSFTRNATVLGLLSAVGPFATDMSLPTLPAIAADLHASTILAYGLPSSRRQEQFTNPKRPQRTRGAEAADSGWATRGGQARYLIATGETVFGSATLGHDASVKEKAPTAYELGPDCQAHRHSSWRRPSPSCPNF